MSMSSFLSHDKIMINNTKFYIYSAVFRGDGTKYLIINFPEYTKVLAHNLNTAKISAPASG